jgi:hypothetical protein
VRRWHLLWELMDMDIPPSDNGITPCPRFLPREIFACHHATSPARQD